MAPLSQSRLAYLTFDIVPAPKGAAVHIESFVKALGASARSVDLVTLAPQSGRLLSGLNWTGVHSVRLPAEGKTFIDRVISFRRHLRHWLAGQHFDVIQVRSIFEGYPIVQQKDRYCRAFIFEVNGMPSIELKYRYPKIAEDPELMHKLLTQEQRCLESADWVITPSWVTRNYLVNRGVLPQRIQVIPNGVNLDIFRYQAPRQQRVLQSLRLLYSGTLTAWQGVDLAVEALALYRRDFEATLTIVGPARGNQIAKIEKLAQRLGVVDAITILNPVSQAQLCRLIHHADAILAPLKANDRNCVQGCCPLKILEAMAAGTPVITSDLPVVAELGHHRVHLLKVRPGSGKAIKDAVVQLRDDPKLRFQISQGGRSQVQAHYSWERAQHSLCHLYQQISASMNGATSGLKGESTAFARGLNCDEAE